MSRQAQAAAEYFLWTGDKNTEKLAYYDQHGNYFEKPVPKGIVDEVLKIFDGRPRAVERSSGGFALVEPFQIVVVEKEGQISIRVRVRFKDLERNERQVVISPKTVSHTKVVLPEELREPFSAETLLPQNFVLDFGRGIIPIHVFDYYRTDAGEIRARFVRTDELESLMTASRGEKRAVAIYETARDVLRAMPHSGGQGKDFSTAKAHAARLTARGEILVPECLATGINPELPTGVTIDLMRHYLRQTLPVEAQHQVITPITINIQDSESEEELIPFGTFEPRR